jgi:hypothetical protein
MSLYINSKGAIAYRNITFKYTKRYTDIIAVQPLPIIDIINNLYIRTLKQINLCDYKHIDSSLLAQILLYADLLW